MDYGGGWGTSNGVETWEKAPPAPESGLSPLHQQGKVTTQALDPTPELKDNNSNPNGCSPSIINPPFHPYNFSFLFFLNFLY